MKTWGEGLQVKNACGTDALSGADRVLRGNVAAKLLREINLPLLVVPLRGSRSAGESS